MWYGRHAQFSLQMPSMLTEHCSGCKQCQHGANLGLASSVSIQEQQDIQSIIHFNNLDPSQPGYYSSKLPLLPDYKNYISSNYEGADLANKKMLQQLQKHPGDAEEISKSYNELIKNKFIIPLKTSHRTNRTT